MKDIASFYPKAKEVGEYTSNCISKLKSDHDFDVDKTILATSVCSDEINRSATTFRGYDLLNMPFQLGGLAGFPFAGLTGVGAFAAHVPDDGCAIILYGPHIGISGQNHLGKVMRTGQKLKTTCCGALVGAIKTFESGNDGEPDKEIDYQQWKLMQELNPKRDEIKNSAEPIVEATDAMFDRINSRVKLLIEKGKDHFKGNKVALVGGIIINTDFGEPDWFEEREFEVHSF